MIEYLIIVLIAVLQYTSYRFIDQKKIRFSKWLLLTILITGQLFVFPKLLFFVYGFDEIECGMPILSLHLFFFLFGGSLNIITHIAYYLNSRLKKTT